VQRLVASAVDKLDAQNVTVEDAEAGEGSGGGTEMAGDEPSAEEVLADRLIHTLEPVVGAEHVRATVHAEFDPGTVEEQQESYDPEKTVALTMQRTEESNGGTQPGGASGTASNVPGGGSPAKLASSEALAQSKSESGTYAVNKIVRHTTQPAGRLKRLAVAVLVDDSYNPADKRNPRQKRSPEELKSIEEIAKASVGFDSLRGDILTVQNISFRAVSTDLPAPPTKLEKMHTLLVDWSQYVRITAMLLLFAVTYVLVLRPVKKQLIRSLKAAHPDESAALNANSGAGADPALPEGEGGERAERPQMAKLKDDISSRVRTEPISASRLVQSWIRNGELP
jgi:flagellar M-ring protein FliF